MTGVEWFAALFAIGAGIGVLAFWIAAIALGRAGALLHGRTDAPYHVAAEFVTAALLIAGGAATIARPDATSSKIVFGLGCGALSYALTEAPGHYLRHGPRAVAAVLFATWPVLIAAVVVRLAT